MITKKLMHDIQTWLNSLYNFNNPSDEKNKHIISSIQNFAFRFIDVNIRIWSLKMNDTLYSVQMCYSKNIRNEEEFEKFKTEVNSTIDKYIKIAINKTNKNRKKCSVKPL